MAQFNLNDYETVEERHARALALHPDMRCVTVNHTTPQDRASGVWVVEARVYLDAADQEADLPKATDWAFEVDGQGMANKTSALENASTSALGRALRWALGGSKGPSQTEMAKVTTGVTPKPNRDWLKEAEALALVYNIDALRVLYADAQATQVGKDVLDAIKEWANVAGKS